MDIFDNYDSLTSEELFQWQDLKKIQELILFLGNQRKTIKLLEDTVEIFKYGELAAPKYADAINILQEKLEVAIYQRRNNLLSIRVRTIDNGLVINDKDHIEMLLESYDIDCEKMYTTKIQLNKTMELEYIDSEKGWVLRGIIK